MRTLWTIGHSTRAGPTSLAMLPEADIAALVDVRRIAASRRHPQFGGEAMARALAGSGHRLRADAGTGRTPRAARGFTEHRPGAMPRFAATPITCSTPAYAHRARSPGGLAAEATHRGDVRGGGMVALPSRADRGRSSRRAAGEVIHLLARGRSEAHPYTRAARIVEGRLDYASPADPQRGRPNPAGDPASRRTLRASVGAPLGRDRCSSKPIAPKGRSYGTNRRRRMSAAGGGSSRSSLPLSSSVST